MSKFPKNISKFELFQNFDTFVFDADGVLWTGDVPIPGASEFLNFLLDSPEKSVFITTNNSTKTLEQYLVDVESKKPKAVVVSFDSHFSYPKLMKAANFLSDPSVEFLVLNEDSTFPGPYPEMILPETGPWSAAIQNVSGRKPDPIFGKPHKNMADFLKSRVDPKKFDEKRTVMFGDRLDTDMMFGNSNGFTTVWMQTGVNTLADIEKAEKLGELDKVPDYTCRFSDFLNE